MVNKRSSVSSFLLVLTAFIWGVAFVAQSKGMEYVGPFTFNFSRNVLAIVVLLPVVFVNDRRQNRKSFIKSFFDRKLIRAGILCGIFLCFATMFQQYGIMLGTSSGKAGFITSLYIIFIPILCSFLGNRPSFIVWLCLPLSMFGLYLLCVKGSFDLQASDVLVFACSLLFALQIIVIDRYSEVDSIRLSWYQFFVSTVLCFVPMMIIERPSLISILNGWIPICFAGILSSGVAYTLQIVAQRNISPTVASILMSLESVFAVLAGWIVLGESLDLREKLGCLLVFVSVIVVQLVPTRKIDK